MENLRIALVGAFLMAAVLSVGAIEKQVNDARQQREAMAACVTDTECEAADGQAI